jgi:hypothetical protein
MITVAVTLAVIAALRGMWSPCGLSMLTSLNPMAERSRGHSFWPTALCYLAGAVLGAGLLGSGCALAAWGLHQLQLSSSVRLAVCAVAALLGVASDTKLLGWSLPEHPRQVNERWLSRYRRWIYASGFGAQIGSGFATYVMTAAVYVVAALAVLTANPLAAMAICLLFGAVRGGSILFAADLATPDALLRRAALLERWAPASLRSVEVAQALAALALGFGCSTTTGAVVLLMLLGGALATGRQPAQSRLAVLRGRSVVSDPYRES